MTPTQEQAIEDLDARLDDTERLASGWFTGSERDRRLVQMVAVYAEGQVRYGLRKYDSLWGSWPHHMPSHR